MTICIATICDGAEHIIMVTDAMITGKHLSIEFEHKRPKITIMANNCAVATAGDALAHTELFEEVREEIDKLKRPKVSDVVKCIKECFVKLRQKEIMERILNPRGIPDIQTFYRMQQSLQREVSLTLQGMIDKYDYGLEILVSGVDGTGAHIHGIFNPGTSVAFDSIGYHAIGSGYPHAITSLIANDFNQDIPLAQALLMTYEAKKISERAPGVGANITNIAIINSKRVKQFSPNEVQELDEVLGRKIASEKEWRKEKKWEEELEKLISNKDQEGE